MHAPNLLTGYLAAVMIQNAQVYGNKKAMKFKHLSKYKPLGYADSWLHMAYVVEPGTGVLLRNSCCV